MLKETCPSLWLDKEADITYRCTMSTHPGTDLHFNTYGEKTVSWTTAEAVASTIQALLAPKGSSPLSDPVNHPSHYNSHPAGIECIDVIEEMPYNVGAAIKYVWRAGLKGEDTHIQDLEKARWHITREIARLKKQEEE